MSKQMSLGREWLVRILVGFVMIPVAILTIGAAAAILPKAAEDLALVAGGVVYIGGSMVASMAIVHWKAARSNDSNPN